jgi:hypothetical protein
MLGDSGESRLNLRAQSRWDDKIEQILSGGFCFRVAIKALERFISILDSSIDSIESPQRVRF